MQLEIGNLSHDGRGVARHEGKAVFVAGALPGEQVIARLVRRHGQFDEAQCEQVLKPSLDRIVPECEHFEHCGGCTLQHFAPAAQLRAKESQLLQNLQRIGKVSPERVLPSLTAPVYGYRRRGRLSVRYVEKKGRTLVGFREPDGRYVADLKRCLVADPLIGERIEALAQLVDGLDVRREIPQIEFAVGDREGALVFRVLRPPSAADRARLIAFGRDTGLRILLQTGGPDSVELLDGEPLDLSFSIPQFEVELGFNPLDFIQVNGALNAAMIDQALTLLAPTANDRVLDLFCGLGNFTLPLARRAGQVIGVEGDAALIARARDNAQRNRIDNAQFVVADLFADQRHAAWATPPAELVLLDPPRAGAETLVGWLPGPVTRRLVYVSCHPASLARDAAVLVQRHGFKLSAAGVMDMFAHTNHVESIALFER